MTEPEVAVVVPTRGRETRLVFLLEALAAQTVRADRFEVVVVRDGEPPGGKATAPPAINVRFISRSEHGGPAAARNEGWRAVSSPLVAFLDDDCRPAPEWLEQVLAARAGTDVIVQGRTEPDPNERHLLFGLARTQQIIGPSAWYQGCNIAYSRDLLKRLGGFDEAFPGPAGEDTDLGLRAVAAGARLVYADGALVWHAVHARPLPQALREAFRWDVVPLVMARHPAQRRLIYKHFFWKASHARLLLALAGLLCSRRSRTLGFLAAIPYLRGYIDREAMGPRGLARQLIHLPVHAAVDAAEVAATTRGALRHRVLVL